MDSKNNSASNSRAVLLAGNLFGDEAPPTSLDTEGNCGDGPAAVIQPSYTELNSGKIPKESTIASKPRSQLVAELFSTPLFGDDQETEKQSESSNSTLTHEPPSTTAKTTNATGDISSSSSSKSKSVLLSSESLFSEPSTLQSPTSDNEVREIQGSSLPASAEADFGLFESSAYVDKGGNAAVVAEALFGGRRDDNEEFAADDEFDAPPGVADNTAVGGAKISSHDSPSETDRERERRRRGIIPKYRLPPDFLVVPPSMVQRFHLRQIGTTEEDIRSQIVAISGDSRETGSKDTSLFAPGYGTNVEDDIEDSDDVDDEEDIEEDSSQTGAEQEDLTVLHNATSVPLGHRYRVTVSNIAIYDRNMKMPKAHYYQTILFSCIVVVGKKRSAGWRARYDD
jgi:hypothetical protein